MCAIIGALVWGLTTPEKLNQANEILNHVMQASLARGRDGHGWMVNSSADDEPNFGRVIRRYQECSYWQTNYFQDLCSHATFIANMRAEPTTEYVAKKQMHDQQPYDLAQWAIVHNGTIANDKELRTNRLPTVIDSAAIVELLNVEPVTDPEVSFWHFYACVRKLKGSYAILANMMHGQNATNELHVAVNYRPVWYIETPVGVFFASARDYFPSEYAPRMVQPYTSMNFRWEEKLGKLIKLSEPLRDYKEEGQRALVVCSGGLDSVVSATYAQKWLRYDVELIHFQYGSRAEGPEVKAVKDVADFLGVPVTLFPLPVYKQSDSPLLDPDSKVAGGEAGAEFAHEWVPARNLLLLSVATAYAEANGFDTIVLGNNLEEAGAYPDNEPEFIAKFNDLLPFAVGDGKFMKVIMPVGNLMKHEIVALGNDIGAPLHLTWSCYRAGEHHCGKCGPCYMRRTAFDINKLPEVIEYDV